MRISFHKTAALEMTVYPSTDFNLAILYKELYTLLSTLMYMKRPVLSKYLKIY